MRLIVAGEDGGPRLLPVRGRPAGREVGEEVGDVGPLDLRRAAAPRREEHAELEQIGAVGVERVPREPALELQIGQEVEDQRLEPRLDLPLLAWA